jgi:hypothetical protein
MKETRREPQREFLRDRKSMALTSWPPESVMCAHTHTLHWLMRPVLAQSQIPIFKCVYIWIVPRNMDMHVPGNMDSLANLCTHANTYPRDFVNVLTQCHAQTHTRHRCPSYHPGWTYTHLFGAAHRFLSMHLSAALAHMSVLLPACRCSGVGQADTRVHKYKSSSDSRRAPG